VWIGLGTCAVAAGFAALSGKYEQGEPGLLSGLSLLVGVAGVTMVVWGVIEAAA